MNDISFNRAYKLITANTSPLTSETVALERSVDRVTSEDTISFIDTPSADISLKDGYALISEDIEGASTGNPITLEVVGTQFAGSSTGLVITKGKAAKITSGAVIPDGANAVLPEEFAIDNGDIVTAAANAQKGRNILKKGTDIKREEKILESNTILTPLHIGLLAAAGYSMVNVYKDPRITIIATGDEVVDIGKPIEKGKVAASNLSSISAWCKHFRLDNKTVVVGDSEGDIAKAVRDSILLSDCIITSGGAWKGERDFVVKVLDKLGWQMFFHRVRMGPGKAIAFGLLNSKPVFCLPGGPPSNQIAFLQLALTGLLRLQGRNHPPFPTIHATLDMEVTGRKDWTQFIMGSISRQENRTFFSPINILSRLQSLSKAEGIISIPEGMEIIPRGSTIKVQILGAHNDVFFWIP
jgi:molybdopterin molybdotransferase